jgi:hypothetical protein
MQNCDGGRVQHPATHVEVAQMEDSEGRFTIRRRVCASHARTKQNYTDDSAGATCVNVTRRKLS